MNINMTWTLSCTHNLDTSGMTRVLICQSIHSANWREVIRTTWAFSDTLYLGRTAYICISRNDAAEAPAEVKICNTIYSTDRFIDCTRTFNTTNR